MNKSVSNTYSEVVEKNPWAMFAAGMNYFSPLAAD